MGVIPLTATQITSLKPSVEPSGYCGTIQNIEEPCRGIFIADIYLKIFEDNVLHNFDIFFTDISKVSSNKNKV